MHSNFYALAFIALFSGSLCAQTPAIARAVPVDPGTEAAQLPPTGRVPQSQTTQSQSSNPNMVPLRNGDSVEIRIAGVPAEDIQQWASLSYTIDESGNLNLPYIRLIKAVGMSPSQLQIVIQNKLVSDGIYTNPTITVNLPNGGVRFVTVGGAVRAPGRIQYSSDLTLISTINAAAGPSDYAGDGIRLIRGGKVLKFSRKKLTKNPSMDPKINPGDQIEVTESWF